MKSNPTSAPSLRATVLALSLLMIGAGCSSTERLNRAATAQGQVQAAIKLPALPDDLRKLEPHAPVTEGQQVISILARERQALQRANARQQRTISFYDDIKTKYEGRTK